MRKPTTPAPKSINLPRHFAWAWLWLLKHAPRLVCETPEARTLLQRMAHAIACLILIRAAQRLPRAATPPPRPPSPVLHARRRRPANLRAAFGSALRRRLKARGAGVRFSALINALRAFEALADALARRLARGLTRLGALIARRCSPDPLFTRARAHAPLAADTS